MDDVRSETRKTRYVTAFCTYLSGLFILADYPLKASQASLAIVLSITESGLEPPSLDRYRNEQAAGILGIPSPKANTDGLALLRRLAVSAPDPESDVIFLPQNRAVNFMKTCQTWLSSDEDIDEDVEGEMIGVFVHLAPILQNVPGSHWELIFDLLENNLEVCFH